MADFGTNGLVLQANTNASTPFGEGGGSATWTTVGWGGSSGANEIRFVGTGVVTGTTSTISSSSWPFFTVPGSVGVVGDAWLFTADTTGLAISTYDGTTAHFLQFRFNWDTSGIFASAPSFTCYSDSTHAVASPGTQPGAQSGSPIINGSSDTSNTSYLKANAYGYGVDTSGTQQTPSSNAGGTLSATSGTAGSVSPGSNAWLSSWQSLMAATQFVTDGVTPKSNIAGSWYFLLSLYCGPLMSTSSAMLPVLTFSYTYV